MTLAITALTLGTLVWQQPASAGVKPLMLKSLAAARGHGLAHNIKSIRLYGPTNSAWHQSGKAKQMTIQSHHLVNMSFVFVGLIPQGCTVVITPNQGKSRHLTSADNDNGLTMAHVKAKKTRIKATPWHRCDPNLPRMVVIQSAVQRHPKR